MFCFCVHLALLFGDELPQHPQQAGIIDSAVDVAAVVRGKRSKQYSGDEERREKNSFRRWLNEYLFFG